jgi:hypothetical protein
VTSLSKSAPPSAIFVASKYPAAPTAGRSAPSSSPSFSAASFSSRSPNVLRTTNDFTTVTLFA